MGAFFLSKTKNLLRQNGVADVIEPVPRPDLAFKAGRNIACKLAVDYCCKRADIRSRDVEASLPFYI